MLRSILVVLLSALLLLVTPVQSLSIVCPVEAIEKGEVVRIRIEGLEDQTEFDLVIVGKLFPGESEMFVLEAKNFTLPFSLMEGNIRARSANTTWTGIAIKKGKKQISATGESWKGIFEMNESMNATSGLYEYLKIEGGVLEGHESIFASLELSGKKSGPRDSEISFEAGEMTGGELTIHLFADGEEVLKRSIAVKGHSGAPSERRYLKSIVSADGVVELNGRIPYGVSIETGAEIGALPTGWRMVGDAYRILPSELDLGSDAILVFRIPPAEGDGDARYPYFVATLQENGWRMLPGSMENGTVTSNIRATGTYALMTFDEEVASVERAPASPWLASIAIGIACILLIRRRVQLKR